MSKYVKRWNDDRPRQGYQLALLGATNKDMARVMGVDIMTIDYWMRTKKIFRDKVNRGKLQADALVAEALFKRATGFSVMEDHITCYQGEIIVTPVKKHYPPDSWAAMKWLSVRQRAIWAETQRIETTHNVNITALSFAGLSTEELMLAKKVGLTAIAERIQDAEEVDE